MKTLVKQRVQQSRVDQSNLTFIFYVTDRWPAKAAAAGAQAAGRWGRSGRDGAVAPARSGRGGAAAPARTARL